MIDLKSKRILIAGASGFIGSHLRDALARHGVPEARIRAPRSEEFDLLVWSDCEKMMQDAEIVFDCAAVPGNIEMRAKIPGTLFYENLAIGAHLVEAAFRAGVEKFVSIGSATEYPAAAAAPFDETTLWDGLPSPGNIPYGLSKRVAALAADLYRRQSGWNAIHVLLTNVYGPRERYESGYMLPSLMQKVLGAAARGDAEIEVWGTGAAVRDLIFAEDAMEGIIAAAERYDEALPLNIASGAGVSIRELVTLLSSLAGYTGSVRWNTDKPEGDLKRLMDVRRAEQHIGFRARTPLGEGLRATIEWHRAHPSRA